jgi:hypothetical protein
VSVLDPVFKFCTADGAAKILRYGSIFITSPLDLNDPLEMRPPWTNAHDQRHRQDQEMRNKMAEGIPMVTPGKRGEVLKMGHLSGLTEPPLMDVDHQRRIADAHNGEVFRRLHNEFRILSFSTGILDLQQSHCDSDETTTLLWSHYGDSFQGVCLALDPTQFDNGLQKGGYAVDYSPTRYALPPEFYDIYQRLKLDRVDAGGIEFEEDPESGLLLMSHNREEKLLGQFIKFLTRKSPAWKYEREVRMIYHLKTFRNSAEYAETKTGRRTLSGANPAHSAEVETYRDGIKLPPKAFRAVVFGADVEVNAVAETLEILRRPEYSHVAVYWSALHSDRYILQYVRDSDKTYTSFIQKQHAKSIASAKGHLRVSKGGLRYLFAGKTVNYVSASEGPVA